MAAKKAIDWFLDLYDSGTEITPEHIERLVKALRPKGRGRPSKSNTHAATLALSQLVTHEKVAELRNISDVSTVDKQIKQATKAGWECVTFNNYLDENGLPLKQENWDLSGRSRQVCLDNGVELRGYTFFIDKNQLKIEIVKF